MIWAGLWRSGIFDCESIRKSGAFKNDYHGKVELFIVAGLRDIGTFEVESYSSTIEDVSTTAVVLCKNLQNRPYSKILISNALSEVRAA